LIEEIEHYVQKVGIMDLRKQKTITRIKNGFKELIKEMNYSSITVQDIIDKSEIGRTTFYLHFYSKDEVLKSIINDIFYHVKNPQVELNHDYTGDENLLSFIHHILNHFKEDKDLLKAILRPESHDIFIQTLNYHLTLLIKERMIPYYTIDYIPEEILINHLSTSLSEIILWWISKDYCSSDESIVSYYYFSLVMPSLTTKGFKFSFSNKIEKIG
jgi:AcrR family transcriptional regulator